MSDDVCESCGQQMTDSVEAHAAHHRMCARLTMMSEALTNANRACERIAAERDQLQAELALVRAHDNGRAVVIRVDPEKEKLVRAAMDAAKGEG